MRSDSRPGISPCDLCGGKDNKAILQGPDFRVGGQALYHLYECKSCGLVSLQPQPDPSTLDGVSPDWLWEDVPKHRDSPQSRINVTLNVLQNWHPRPGTLLDVGCGSGGFMLAAERTGWQAKGIEISSRQAMSGLKRGADITVSSDFPTYQSSGQFDALCFNHVIEHVPSPRAYLIKAASLLKPDGILLISLPNYGCLSRRLFGKYWTHLDLPRHLFHFTPKTLGRLLESTDCRLLATCTHIREDNSVGIRDSMFRWVVYGLLHREPGLHQVLQLYAHGNKTGLQKAIADVYRSFGNVAASITERLNIADTFIVVAQPIT